MENTVFFLNMFSAYQPPEYLQTVLSQAAIAAADIDQAARSVSLKVRIPSYVSDYDLNNVSEEIAQVYGLSRVEIQPVFPSEELKNLSDNVLTSFFLVHNSMAIAVLAGAKFQWEADTLHIYLVGNGKEELKEPIQKVVKRFQELFEVTVSIELHAGENLTGQALYDAMAKMRMTMMQDLPKVSLEPSAPL